jgi:serine/threonine protein kinase
MPGTFRGDSKPETIDRFQVVRLLGRGGMGDVYDAFDAGVSRYVAIKLLRADLYDVPAVAETFVSEAQRIAKLEAHENIPTVYEVGVHEHRPFIAMQKIEGLTLAELLRKRGVVSVDTLRVVASGVGGALAFAHDRGIVHCDVKPQNVLLDRAQKPYLTDFGISRARPDPLGAEAPDLCGHTPYYASPEQLAGRVPDVRSDVYSLAVMLYEMCTGKTPFGHIPQVDLPEAVLGEEPSRADELNPHVPTELGELLGSALNVDPSKRPQTAMALVRGVLAATDQGQRLSQWAELQGVVTERAGSGMVARSGPTSTRSKSPGLRTALVAALLLIGGSTGAWFAFQRQASRSEARQSGAGAMQRELPATATKAEAPIKTAKPVDASFSVGQSKELRPDEATPKEARPDGARPVEAKDRPDRSESVGQRVRTPIELTTETTKRRDAEAARQAPTASRPPRSTSAGFDEERAKRLQDLIPSEPFDPNKSRQDTGVLDRLRDLRNAFDQLRRKARRAQTLGPRPAAGVTPRRGNRASTAPGAARSASSGAGLSTTGKHRSETGRPSTSSAGRSGQRGKDSP